MKRRIWKRLIAVGCAASLLMAAPEVMVLANEIGEDLLVVDGGESENDFVGVLDLIPENNGETDSIDNSEEIEQQNTDSFETPYLEEDDSVNDISIMEDEIINEDNDISIKEDEIINEDGDEELVGAYVTPDFNSCVSSYSELGSRLETLKSWYVGTYWTTDGQPANSIGSTSLSYYGIQCNGFAKLIFTDLFNTGSIGAYDSNKYYFPDAKGAYLIDKNASVGSGDANAVKAILQYAEIGDFIQVHRRGKDYGHSMIVTGKDDGGIWIFDCNADGHCKVQHYYQTWATFASKNDKMSLYHSINYPPIENNPPSELWINTNKQNYKIGEAVEFSFGSKNASTLAIPIDVNGKREFFNHVEGRTSYSQSFDVPGVYGYYLYGNNSAGDATSEYKEFYVYNEKPRDLWISIDKEEYEVGEEVTFTFNSKYAARLAIPIDVNGKREFFNEVTNQTSYKQAFTVPGVYGFFLYANNDYGEVSSEYKEFYVYNEKPKDLKISTDKEEYAVGEKVNFTFSGKYAKTLAIPIDVNGTREFYNHVDGKSTYSQTFTVPGTYGYYLVATNASGVSTSEYKEFKVVADLPKDLTISTDKDEYAVGEEVKFTFSGKNAKTLAIPIDVNGTREFYNHVDGQSSYTQTFTVPGSYGYYLVATNASGVSTSEYKMFYVYKEKPKDLKISVDKEKYEVGEEVNFTFSGKYAKTLAIPIDVNGTREFFIHVDGKTNYKQCFDVLGQYGYYLYGTNEYGNATAEYKDFYVYDRLSSDKTTVSLSQQTYTYDGNAKRPSVIVKQGTQELKEGSDYTITYSNNVNAGTATVIITGKGNYIGDISKTYAINRLSVAEATVTGIVNKTYSGLAQTQNPTVKVGDKTLTSGTDYTVGYSNNVNVGTATVTMTGKGNYTGSISKTFTISALSIANATVTGIANKTYSGSVQTQNPTVKVGDKTLTSGTNYTIGYSNNVNVGTATVIITGKGNYTGSISKTFTISAISGSGATVTGISNKTYTGSAQTQNPTVKVNDKTLVSGTDYTLSYSNNTNAGTAKVTITFRGNYTGSVSKTFTINQASPTLTFASASFTKTTLDAAFTNEFTKKTDGTVTFKSSNTNVATVDSTGKVTIKGEGTATITASATAGTNYKAGSASYDLTVVDGRQNISGYSVTLSPTSYTYNGSACKPVVTVKNGSFTLTSGTDYIVSYSNNTNVGTGKVTITGKGSYTGTINKTFTINQAAPTLTFASASVTKTTLDAAFTNALTKKTDGAVTFKSSNTNVATVDSASGLVTINGMGTTTVTATATVGTNYKAGSASYTLTVVDGRIDISTCTVTLSATSYTYNGSAKKPTVTVKNGSTTLTSGTDYTVAYKNNTNAGTATATVTGKGNYMGTASKTFTINKAAASLKFASASVEKTTLDAAFTNELTKTTDGIVTFKSDDEKVATVDNDGFVTIKGNGTTTITATASAGKNYKAGNASYTLTVADGSIAISTCTITLSPTSYTYNGSAKKPTVTVKNGSTTLKSGTDYTVAYKNNTNAGTATATVTGKGNYTGTASKTFTINKAAASLKFASASVEKTTLDAAFTNELTKTTDGIVTYKSGDSSVATVDSTSGLVTIKGEGTSTITATATDGTNFKAGSGSYTLTVVDGRIDISTCTVTLSATSYTYNGSAKKPTVTVKNGSTTLTSGTDYTVAYKNNTNAGTATVTITGKGNYKGTVSKTFTIKKAASSLKFAENAVSKSMLDEAFTNELTKTTDGTVTFTSNDTDIADVDSTSGLVTIKGAGTAVITATVAAGKNYNAGNASYALTVTPVSIEKASVAGVSLSYGYSGKAYTPKMTVKVNGVTLKEGTDYTVKIENNKNPGTATITITGIGNYTGTRIKTFEIVDCVSSLVSGKTYQIIPKNNSSTAVCAYSGQMLKNTKVYITDRSASEAMRFKAIQNSDGTWKFINAKCEMALAVQQNSSALGAGIVLYDQTTKAAQNWKLSKKSDNSWAIMNAVTGYSIAMSDESAVKGTTLSMAETQSNGLQRFYIAETDPVDASFDGTYFIKAGKDKNYVVNISGASKEAGANVNLNSYSNTNSKKFKVVYSGAGYYRLVNVNSGLVLSVEGNTKQDWTNIIQSEWAAESGQRWKFTKNSDGTVTLTNALGTNLHLNGNKTSSGTNIVARNASTSSAQKWYLQ